MDEPTPTLLVVCTANECRSPLAGGFLARSLGGAARVVTAGTDARVGRPAAAAVRHAAAELGCDLDDHRSRALTTTDVAAADLVLAMTRGHVREIVARHPEAFARTLTLKELVRRAGSNPPVPAGDLAAWLRSVTSARRPADLLGRDSRDDVADPTGRGPRAFAATAEELRRLGDDLAAALVGPGGPLERASHNGSSSRRDAGWNPPWQPPHPR